ncbi:DUF6624 domain-containing protein [Streptomyces sp. SID1034]|uniref:DUF6624 domain-containing protein n=1 Tax=Streptomyces sp. SID1034 TaxID=2690248 RepID=UPI0013705033|nr:DUF6624 domain-containing protein [Streptomyces sp. SID1034]MYV93779.1 DUF4135 domain-containing protein [Streptomyces sp. SID1034]
MPDVLWELRAPAAGKTVKAGGTAQLAHGARRLLESLAAGGAQGMFPPVVTDGPDGTVVVLRHLSGPAEAAALTEALADPRLAPFLGALDRLDAWCLRAASQWNRLIGPGVLDLTNAQLFGPLSTELLEACLTSAEQQRAADFAVLRVAQYERFLDLFLRRLGRDLTEGLPDVPGIHGLVTAIRAHGDETHNGGGRVLRVEFAGGGRLAYKPRPASGEALFLAEGPEGAAVSVGPAGSDGPSGRPADSVFALLNGLPPASGPVRLPVLRCRRGRDAEGAGYSWHEWIEPPESVGVLRADGELALRGVVLGPLRARHFWHRAGALAAASFAFGITDLMGPNVPAGTRPGDDGPLLYPVDLEVYFTDAARLADTGLVQTTSDGGHHHVGLENVPRWCDLDGPPTCWTRDADGVLRLARRTRPLARTWTSSVVADTEGRAGYGPYLGRMLRGMFDAWTLMCRHREGIAEFIAGRAPGHVVRVLARPTREYAATLAASAPGAATADFAPDEWTQLARGDVPYFFRDADGGPLHALDPPGGTVHVELPDPADGCIRPPVAAVREGGRLDLARLGIALRDAVEHVFADLDGPEVAIHDDGVRITLRDLHRGEVSFDWTEIRRRITYSWDASKLRLRIAELTERDAMREAGDVGSANESGDVASAGEAGATHARGSEASPAYDGIRDRLLRLGRVDAALRGPWAASGFTDTQLEAKLGRLTDSGAEWLDGVIAEHGWPGRRLVGAEASTVASGLVQHLVDRTDFQRRCLRLIEAAAMDGDMRWCEAAYLVDALRLAEGREQVYGTKFQSQKGELVPSPIEDASHVDERRAGVGLGPLDDYAARLREHFGQAGGVSA